MARKWRISNLEPVLSPAEAKMEQESLERLMAFLELKVRLAEAGRSNGDYGKVLCPLCKKKMAQWSIARSNGHHAVSCEDETCLRMME